MDNIINVFLCVRNNENILELTLENLIKIEKDNSNYKFKYYMYENDSIDNTKKIVLNFYKNHNGNCLFETLKKKQWGCVKDNNRSLDMSYYRNKMKSLCKNFNNSKYSLILDTNVLFDVLCFKKMIDILENNLDIHMVTPYGVLENKPNKYYDTYALSIKNVYGNKALYFLNKQLKYNDIVDINSGFSGFSIIRSETLYKCNWGTEINNICSEHNVFCNEVNMYGRIVCCKNIKVYWSK